MTMPNLATPKGLSMTLGALLLLGGGAWGWSRAGNTEQSTLPDELSVEALKQRMTDPEQSPGLRGSFRRDDMTDEQRQELRRNMRLAGRAVMREHLDEYFNADPADQEAVLDQHIDELAAQMDAWRNRREEGQRDRNRERGNRERRNRPTPTKQQQKSRAESRNPDEAAQQMVYFAALRAQAQARGVNVGRGMGGFGGRGAFGGRGGFGGGGGGGRRGSGGGGRGGGGGRRP